MAGKRRATYDLNRDNCEEELPKEEAGNWKPAADDALKGRPILKARRSLANTSQSPASSPFGGFSFNLGTPKTSFGTSGSVPNFSFGLSPATNGNLNSTPKPSGTPSAAAPPGNQVSVTTSKKSKPDEQEVVKKELSIEDRLKEILTKRQKLLEEKQRIESELQKLEEEEKEIHAKQKSDCKSEETSSKQASDDELELPPEEPWN